MLLNLLEISTEEANRVKSIILEILK